MIVFPTEVFEDEKAAAECKQERDHAARKRLGLAELRQDFRSWTLRSGMSRQHKSHIGKDVSSTDLIFKCRMDV